MPKLALLVALCLAGCVSTWPIPADAQCKPAQGCTGSSLTGADDKLLVGIGTRFDEKAVPDCDAAGFSLTYDTGTNAFGCGANGEVLDLARLEDVCDGTPNQIVVWDGSGNTSCVVFGGVVVGSPTSLSFASGARDFYPTFYRQGFPTDAEAIYAFTFPVAVSCADNWAGSSLKSSINFAATKTFDVQKNGSSLGVATCNSGGKTCAFNTTGGATSFSADDELTVIAPATADVAARDIHATFVCTR